MTFLRFPCDTFEFILNSMFLIWGEINDFRKNSKYVSFKPSAFRQFRYDIDLITSVLISLHVYMYFYKIDGLDFFTKYLI